jgi:very-short-patch-repair endonuclease
VAKNARLPFFFTGKVSGFYFFGRKVVVQVSFQTEHDKWIGHHLKRRKGECLDALKRGHGYGNRLFAERIWWPMVGHFTGLHPEYEVKDWRGRSYFADFMWIVGASRIVFEIMDYGSHGQDRTKYRMDLNRGLFLQSQDCLVVYMSLDEIKENPTFILSSLRSILAPYLSVGSGMMERSYSKIERDLMRAAIRHNRVIKPAEAARELELHTFTVIKYCRLLVEKGKFRAVARGTSQRVIYYEYVGTVQSADLV